MGKVLKRTPNKMTYRDGRVQIGKPARLKTPRLAALDAAIYNRTLQIALSFCLFIRIAS